MDQAFKERWIAALESGEYPKGVGALRTSNGGYCCLGVACELLVADGVVWPAEFYVDEGCFSYRDVGAAPGDGSALVFLTDRMATLIGLTEEVRFPPYSAMAQGKLAEINDASDSFAPVVEWIRENL